MTYFYRTLVTTGVLLTSFLTLQAQIIQLNEVERREFEDLTLVKINEFQNQLKVIASKNETAYTKRIYKETCLELFMNKGKGFTMEVSYLNPDTRDERRKRYPMITYLDRLASLPYAKVNMKRAKSCHVSKFRKSGNR